MGAGHIEISGNRGQVGRVIVGSNPEHQEIGIAEWFGVT